MINDDDLLKAKIISGPEPTDHINSQEELIKNLISSVDLLTETILYTLNESIIQQNNLLSQLAGQIVTNQSSGNFNTTSEDFEQTNPRGDTSTEPFNPATEEMRQSIVDAIQRGLLGIINIAGQAVYTGSVGGINAVGNTFAGGIAGGATQMMGVQNQQVNTMLTTAINASISHVIRLGGVVVGATGAIGAFTIALGGAVAALAIFEGISAWNTSIQYQRMVLRTDPNAMGIMDFGSGFHTFHEDIQKQLIGGRGEEDIQRLVETALSMRPGDEGTRPNVANMAVTVGYLEDHGISQETTGRLGYSMMKDLQLNYQQTNTALRTLADTAKQHGIEMGSYIEKIIELSKKYRGLGVNIKDVNSIFNKFMNDTFAGGVKATAAEALGATEIALGAQAQLKPGAAAWIATTTASRMKPTGGRGFFQGVDQTFGELMKQGPIGAYLAQTYVRAGMVDPSVVFESVKQMTDRALMMAGEKIDPKSKRYHDLSMAFADPILKSYGIEGGNISDPKYQLFLRNLAENKLTKKDFDKARQDFGARTNTDVYQKLVDLTQIMQPWEEIWAEIRDTLGGSMLPLLMHGMTILATLGEFVISLGEHNGDMQKAAEDAMGTYNDLSDLFIGSMSGKGKNAGIHSKLVGRSEFGKGYVRHWYNERHQRQQLNPFWEVILGNDKGWMGLSLAGGMARRLGMTPWAYDTIKNDVPDLEWDDPNSEGTESKGGVIQQTLEFFKNSVLGGVEIGLPKGWDTIKLDFGDTIKEKTYEGSKEALTSITNSMLYIMSVSGQGVGVPTGMSFMGGGKWGGLTPTITPSSYKGGDILTYLVSAARDLGLRVTSTTGGSHNLGSKHYRRMAIDVDPSNMTPDKIAKLRAMGVTVIDERIRPKGQAVWGGPHYHLEMDLITLKKALALINDQNYNKVPNPLVNKPEQTNSSKKVGNLSVKVNSEGRQIAATEVPLIG